MVLARVLKSAKDTEPSAKPLQSSPGQGEDVDVSGRGDGDTLSNRTSRACAACFRNDPLNTRKALECLQLRCRSIFLVGYLPSALVGGWAEMMQAHSPKSPTRQYRLIVKEHDYLMLTHIKPERTDK